MAQETQPGDPCTAGEAGFFRQSSETDPATGGNFLICNGSNYVGFIRYDSAGNVGIVNTAPKAPLDVGGEVKVGTSTGLACDADREGAMRWSSADSTFQMCDGSNWRLIAAASTGNDCTPDAFAFTDLTNQPLSTTVASNTVNITGIDAGCAVSVTGGGTPQISVNGGGWVTSTTIDPGDSLQVRMITSGSVSTELIATVSVGTGSDAWNVTTTASGTRMFATANSYVGGSIGGIGGGHTICTTEAGNLGYSGLWRALLSNESINAKDMLTIDYPVTRASDGTTIDSTNLWDGSIENQVSASGSEAWTGTASDGTVRQGITCGNWRSTSEFGQLGQVTNTGPNWLQWGGGNSCSGTDKLYCVEQASSIGALLSIFPKSAPGMYVGGSGSPAYSSATTFTVENAGDQTSATISTSVSNTTNFELLNDNCDSTTLAQGATCTVDVRAKANLPGGEGTFNGTLNITANNNPSASLSAAAGVTRMFDTGSRYTPNLGGLSGADSTCQTEATNLGLSGTWKALLSDSSTNAKDRVTITYPVLNARSGETLDSTNIWDGNLEASFDNCSWDCATWTGSATDGTAKAGGSGDGYCGDWTTTSGSARAGETQSSNTRWIDREDRNCTQDHFLYCVEQ